MARRNKKELGPSSRPIKVGEQVRHALSEILREGALKDPRIVDGLLVTVTGVDMTPDLKTARAFVSVFPDDDLELVTGVFAGLQSATSIAQREIASRLRLRFTPIVEFHRDDSMAYGAKIEALLKDIGTEDVPDGQEED